MGTLGVVTAFLTYKAVISLGSAVRTIFIFWEVLASKGRAAEVLGLLPVLVPGIFWAAIAAFAWAAFFAVKKQETNRE